MSRHDWFRRNTWTDQDRREFNAQLERGRGSKAQFLRIQAGCLAAAGQYAAAIELLDRMFDEFPDEIQLAQGHLQKAESLFRLGKIEPSILEFRLALQAERDFPNVKTQAWVDFPFFIVSQQCTDLFAEAVSVFEEFADESALAFPATRYRYFVVLALVAHANGEQASARQYAKEALAEASKERSGLRYHPTVGLVGARPDDIDQQLRKLARE